MASVAGRQSVRELVAGATMSGRRRELNDVGALFLSIQNRIRFIEAETEKHLATTQPENTVRVEHNRR